MIHELSIITGENIFVPALSIKIPGNIFRIFASPLPGYCLTWIAKESQTPGIKAVKKMEGGLLLL